MRCKGETRWLLSNHISSFPALVCLPLDMRQPLALASLPIPTLVAWFICLIPRFGHHRALSLYDSFSLSPSSLFPLLSSCYFFSNCSLGGNHSSCALGIQLEQTSTAHLLPSHSLPSSRPACPEMSPFHPQMSPFRKQYITSSIRGSLLATRHSQPESPLTTPN